MARGVRHCTYCCKPIVGKATADHCPPKQLFPAPLPNNLRTVDACEPCNAGAKIDEDYFRAVLLQTEIADTPAGKRLLAGKAGRGFAKDKGLRATLVRGMQWLDATSETGILLGRQLVIDVERARLERIAVKIARGLFWLEHGALLPANVGIFPRFIVGNALYEAAAPMLPHLRWGKYHWQAYSTTSMCWLTVAPTQRSGCFGFMGRPSSL